jgi:predicted ATPase
LSLQLAADVASQFPDGTFFVPLSAVTDPVLIPSAIGQSIGVSIAGNSRPMDVVKEHLREKHLLLVLDNLEQLLPAGGPVVSDILREASGVKVVASSRAPLHVYGEQEMALQPLQLPKLSAVKSAAALSQYEAVKLFIERAVAAKHDFRVTNENAPAIAGICEQVDGLPLAIELAAARIKLFSPQALLARLESSTSILAGGARDLPGRQQTLRGAIAWSHDLLDDAQKRLFARFGVFARGAGLEQAETVCGPESEVGVDVLTGLDELADQSLIRRMPDFDEPRLLMLQVIRDFALERLEASGEASVIRDRHAAAYQALAEEAAPQLLGAQRKQWLDRLQLDHDNFRAAFDWVQSQGDVLRALCLAAAFWRFWQMRGHLREGRARLDGILAMPGADQHPRERARALEAAGGVAHWQGDIPAEKGFYDECLALARASGDKKAIANALYNATFPRFLDERYIDEGLTYVHEALSLYRELGDDQGMARVQWAIGNVLHQRGDSAQAVEPLDEAIAINRRLGDTFGLGWAMHTRIVVAIVQRDADLASKLTREALEIFAGAGDVTGIVVLLDDAASVAKLRGDSQRALTLAGAAAVQQAASGATLASVINVNEGRAWQDTIATPEEQRAWAEGQAMSADQAVAYALESPARATSGSAPA